MSNLFPRNAQHCYSYLSNVRKHKQTPILEQGFKRQQDLERFFVHGLQRLAVVYVSGVKEIIADQFIKLIYSSQNEKIKFHGALFSTDWINSSSTEILLQPSFLNDNFSFQQKHIEQVLTSAYDDNAFNAQEIPFNVQKTAFSKNEFLHANERQNKNYYSPLTFVSREDRFTGKLHHLRRSPDCQGMALLSELLHSPQLLMSHDGRQYIMLTIFQPGALRAALHSGADIWSVLNALHDNYRLSEALDYPEKTEWFILKLAAAISHYSLSLQQEEGLVFNQTLAWQIKILNATNIRLSQKETSISEQAELHYLKLSALSHQQTHEVLPDILTSYFTLALLPKMGRLLEDQIQALLEKIFIALTAHRQHPEMPQYLIQTLISIEPTLAIPCTNAKISFCFPLLHLYPSPETSIVINLAERCITKNGKTMTYLPLCYLDAAEYHDELKSAPVLTLKTTGLLNHKVCVCYTWIQNKQSYRILEVERAQQVFWQKEINGRWYTLATPSKSMAKTRHFSQYAFESPPALFEQALFQVWITDASHYVVLNKVTQEHLYVKENGTISVYQAGLKVGTLKQYKHIPKALLRLEDERFIEPLLNSKGQCYQWRLPRYGITIIQDKKNQLCTQDGRHALVCPDIKADAFDAGLIFVSKDNPKNQHLVIPLQPFYTAKKIFCDIGYQHGIYFQSVHDFSNNKGQGAHITNNNLGWDYLQSESFVTIPMDVLYNPELATTRLLSEDQIYLAYLYLKQDQPNLAFQILKTCQYQGTHEETRRLWWILDEPPAAELPQTPTNSTASRVIAVKTFVLSVLMRLLNDNPNLCTPKILLSKTPSNTQRLAEEEALYLRQFFVFRFEYVSIYYTCYDNRRNNIPHSMRLSMTEEKLLLSLYFAEEKRIHHITNQGTPFAYKETIGTRYLELFPESEPLHQRIVHYDAPYPEFKPIYKAVLNAIFHSGTVTHTPIPSNIYGIHQPSQTSSIPINPLIFSSALSALYIDIQQIEQVYETEKTAIVTEVNGLASIPWKTQTVQFKELDERLLRAYRKKQAAQNTCCLQYQKTASHTHDLKELYSGKMSLEQEELRITSSIHAILNRRKANKIAEYGKQLEAPCLENLITKNLTHQAVDYDAMGILKTDQLLLRDAIQQYIGVISAQRQLETIIKLLEAHPKTTFKTTSTFYGSIFRQKSLSPSPQPNPELIRTTLSLQNKAIHPEETLFQYIQNITLRPEQITILSRLIANNKIQKTISYAIELVMGGGKSKVILPLLGRFLAINQQLLVLLVPPSLLDINYKDLRKTSFTTFGQEVYMFRFDRNMPSDPHSLQKHLELFETARLHQAYIVTTPTSIQSLELKYLELLRNSKQHTNAIDCLNKILILLRNSTAIIDEAHSLLHIRKELNYAVDEKRRISFHLVETSILLFASIESAPAFHGLRFKDLLAKPQDILADEIIVQLMQHYVGVLCQEPLIDWISDLQITPFTPDEFKTYLLSETTDEEEARIYQILDTYPVIKAKWILLREEFTLLLPLTLRKKLRENYGPSIDDTPFAIPYRANNTPTECIFGNFMETINYTIQMFYNEGIPYSCFKAILEDWKSESLLERKENKSTESSAEKRFRMLFPNEKHITLHTLNFEIDEKIHQLHEMHRNNTTLIQYVLSWCLSQLMIDSNILNSDALNLVDMFHQSHLFSASADNYHTFHDRIKIMPDMRLLIASQMTDVMKRKNTELTVINLTDIHTFLSRLLDSQNNFSALIDCGSWLRGRKNLDIAKTLASLCVQKQTSIRYILFYQADTVYALNVETYETEAPRQLASSKAVDIQQDLNNAPPETWFVYYDEEHTLGSDIENGPSASALVTVDIDTEISAFLQACGRMRGFLERAQTLKIALTPQLAIETTCNLDALLRLLRLNEEKRLETDHYKATLKKIYNVFRNDLLTRLLGKTSTARDIFFTQSQSFFMKSHSDDMAMLYQEKAKNTHLRDILKEYTHTQQSKWSRIVREEVTPDELSSIQQSIDAITKKAHLICSPEQWYQANQQDSIEVQQEQQVEVETEKQTILASESYKVQPNALDLSWISSYQWLFRLVQHIYPHPSINSLLARYQLTFTFDPHLHATTNFLYTHNCQSQGYIAFLGAPPDIYNFYTKPGLALLFEVNSVYLSATLICMEEAEALQQASLNTSYSWLSMIDGTCLTHQPKLTESQTKQMQLLLEQAAFFTGRVDILLSSRLTWMKKDYDKKSQFLKETIQPHTDITDEQLMDLDRKSVDLAPCLNDWMRQTNGDVKTYIACLTRFPEPIKKNLETLLMNLNEMKQANHRRDFQPFSGSFHDYLLLKPYELSITLLRLLKQKQYIMAAEHFTEYSMMIPIGCLAYVIQTGPIEFGPLVCLNFIELLEGNTKLSFLVQFLSLHTLQKDISRIQPVLDYLNATQLLTTSNISLLLKETDIINHAINILNFKDCSIQKHKSLEATIHAFCTEGMSILLKGMSDTTHLELNQAAERHLKQSPTLWKIAVDASIFYVTRGVGTVAVGLVRRLNHKSFFFFNEPSECESLCEEMILKSHMK